MTLDRAVFIISYLIITLSTSADLNQRAITESSSIKSTSFGVSETEKQLVRLHRQTRSHLRVTPPKKRGHSSNTRSTPQWTVLETPQMSTAPRVQTQSLDSFPHFIPVTQKRSSAHLSVTPSNRKGSSRHLSPHPKPKQSRHLSPRQISHSDGRQFSTQTNPLSFGRSPQQRSIRRDIYRTEPTTPVHNKNVTNCNSSAEEKNLLLSLVSSHSKLQSDQTKKTHSTQGSEFTQSLLPHQKDELSNEIAQLMQRLEGTKLVNALDGSVVIALNNSDMSNGVCATVKSKIRSVGRKMTWDVRMKVIFSVITFILAVTVSVTELVRQHKHK